MFVKIDTSTVTNEVTAAQMSQPSNQNGWIEIYDGFPNVQSVPTGMRVVYTVVNGRLEYHFESFCPLLLSIETITAYISQMMLAHERSAQDALTLELLESGVL